jgi:hypothetical protein
MSGCGRFVGKQESDSLRSDCLSSALQSAATRRRTVFSASQSKPDKFALCGIRPIVGTMDVQLLILPLGISGFPPSAPAVSAGPPVYPFTDRDHASIVHLPAVLGFLWAPLVDTVAPANWLVLGALGTSWDSGLRFR